MASKRKKGKIKPEAYRQRTYRQQVDSSGLVSFFVRYKETDLHILASAEMSAIAGDLVLSCRQQLESYIADHPGFLAALSPLAYDAAAPPLAKKMLNASRAAGVGPMAAVAGAIAEAVGKGLIKSGSAEVIVENGGDIFLARRQDCTVGIFAGASPLSGRVGINIKHSAMPIGICTSSATVGHSLSLGEADSVTVLAASTALADAAATRLGNEVRRKSGINPALEIARTIPDIRGVLIILGDQLGAWGDIEIFPFNE